MNRLLFYAVAIAALGYIFFQIIDFFFSVNSPKSRYKKDKRFGKVEVDALSQDLVPFDEDEGKLLSFEKTAKRKIRTSHTEFFGKVNSIFHEPLVGYYKFEYPDGRMLLLTKNSKADFSFYHNGEFCEISINDSPSFLVTNNYDFIDPTSKTKLASLDVKSAAEAASIRVDDREVAQMHWHKDVPEEGRIVSLYKGKNELDLHITYCYSILNIFRII